MNLNMQTLEWPARVVAEASVKERDCAAVATKAAGEKDKLNARIEALDIAREDIRNRRKRGEQRADDGAQLEINSMDRQDLVLLLEKASLVAEAAAQEHASANQVLGSAHVLLRQAEARLQVHALSTHVSSVLDSLAEALRRRDAAATDLPAEDDAILADTAIATLEQLEAALLANVAFLRARAACRQNGPRLLARWKPRERLVNEIRRLDLNDGRLG